jgi:hypothetical protein
MAKKNFFRGQKMLPKISGYFCIFQKKLANESNRPVGENSPNKRKFAQLPKIRPICSPWSRASRRFELNLGEKKFIFYFFSCSAVVVRANATPASNRTFGYFTG